MPTLVLDPQPEEVTSLIERRRRLGQDLFDEVWDGVLHMNPAPSGRHGKIDRQLAVLLEPVARHAGLTSTGPFNLGEAHDFRVPDGGLHRDWRDRVWYPTAAMVLEIVSPGDETYAKLPFYAAHQVYEVMIVDPDGPRVRWLGLVGAMYEPIQASRLIDLGPARACPADRLAVRRGTPDSVGRPQGRRSA
jgi:Uma2 family endonuclease